MYQSGQFDLEPIRRENPRIDLGVMMLPHPPGTDDGRAHPRTFMIRVMISRLSGPGTFGPSWYVHLHRVVAEGVVVDRIAVLHVPPLVDAPEPRLS
jgi:hypothetical protein